MTNQTLDAFAEDENLRALERELRRTKDERDELSRRLKAIDRDEDSAERVREKIIGIAGISPDPPYWLVEPISSTESHPGVPTLLLTDWHFGEVVNREQVGGVNEFSTPIAIARARLVMEKVVNICFKHMLNPVYPGIVVNVSGDLFSGDIHEELQDTNDEYTHQTFKTLFGVFTWALPFLADHFGNVFSVWVPGNHDRTGKLIRHKGRPFTSYEWLLACMLERFFENDPRIKFLIPNEADAHYRVYGKRYMTSHLDSMGVRGGDGIIGAIGPLMRGTIKMGRLEAQIGRDFDVLVGGHWHQQVWLPNQGLICGNTLKGYDEYARLALRAPYSPPSQLLWFTHETEGITVPWQLFLESPAVGQGGWISWIQA